MAGQRKRGFAAMSPEKQREIASKGGQAAHRKGTAHEFSSEEAREAGRLGGKIISSNRAHMAVIGRKGGQHSLYAQRAAKNLPTNGHADQPNTLQHNESTPSSQGATSLLRADHRRVNSLFHQYEAQEAMQDTSTILARQLCAELEVHGQLEEEIFYPALREYLDEEGRRQIDEGLREHQQIKEFIAQVRECIDEGSVYDHLVQDLYKIVDHHVYEEEQSILPRAEQCLGDQLEELGTRMRIRKQQSDLSVTQSDTPPGMLSEQVQE